MYTYIYGYTGVISNSGDLSLVSLNPFPSSLLRYISVLRSRSSSFRNIPNF